MTLQSSGPISISQIRAEFGGSAPDSISEYYAAASGVPASGAISISDFYGTSSVNVEIDDLTVSQIILIPNVDTVSISYLTTGLITATNDSGLQWWGAGNTSGIGSSYDIRATLQSGLGVSSGTLNTWQRLSSNRGWSLTSGGNVSPGNYDTTLLIEIRDATTLVVEDSATVLLRNIVQDPDA